MNESNIPLYCVHCLMDGIIRPATVFAYSYVDELRLPLCAECYEIEINSPVEMEICYN